MIDIKLELDQLYGFIGKEQLMAYEKPVYNAYRKIYNRTGPGSEFLGWVDLPSTTHKDLLQKLKHMQPNCDKNLKFLW